MSQQRPVQLDDLRGDLAGDDSGDDREHSQQHLQQQRASPDEQQQQEREQEKELPPIPVDHFFYEACRRSGVEHTTAWNNNNNTRNNKKPSAAAAPEAPKRKAPASNPRARQQQQQQSPRSIIKPQQQQQQQKPQSRTSSRASSSRASSVDSVAAVAENHRAVAAQERRMRDLLVVLTERGRLMQEASKTVTRNLRFKQKIHKKANALRANAALNAAWEKELSERENVKKQAVGGGGGSRTSRSSGYGDGDEDSNNNSGRGSVISATRDHGLDQSLGRGGEDALFEQALRQRQFWDLRHMRQQRARDRREAEYAVRLRRAEEKASDEWHAHDRANEEAKLICRANHVRVKERRARDEAHIANVEARFAMIDEQRAQQYREHLQEINGARQRRDQTMRSVVDGRKSHAQHMDEVAEHRQRRELERSAVIQNNLEQLEQQRTRHEFLRFVRDVELANRSLAERDHTLLVVHRSEEQLEERRHKIMGGFARTEQAVARIERERAEGARAHAESREQKHYEARTLRIANDEAAALRRLEKEQREAAVRERKARDDERQRTLAETKFEQRRVEQEDRVERLSRRMMSRREEVLRQADQRHGNVAQRRQQLNKIRTEHSSSAVDV